MPKRLTLRHNFLERHMEADDIPSRLFTFQSTTSSHRFEMSSVRQETPSISDHSYPSLCHFHNGLDGSLRWNPVLGRSLSCESFQSDLFPSPARGILDCDKDSMDSDSIEGSFVQRRRHGEYFHRPPVWNIRPLVKYDNSP